MMAKSTACAVSISCQARSATSWSTHQTFGSQAILKLQLNVDGRVAGYRISETSMRPWSFCGDCLQNFLQNAAHHAMCVHLEKCISSHRYADHHQQTCYRPFDYLGSDQCVQRHCRPATRQGLSLLIWVASAVVPHTQHRTSPFRYKGVISADIRPPR